MCEAKKLKKVLIFGNSGSGKSTLAKKLCELDGLSHLDLDLDMLAWQSTMPPKRKLLEDSKKYISEFMRLNPGWVIEPRFRS